MAAIEISDDDGHVVFEVATGTHTYRFELWPEGAKSVAARLVNSADKARAKVVDGLRRTEWYANHPED